MTRHNPPSEVECRVCHVTFVDPPLFQNGVCPTCLDLAGPAREPSEQAGFFQAADWWWCAYCDKEFSGPNALDRGGEHYRAVHERAVNRMAARQTKAPSSPPPTSPLWLERYGVTWDGSPGKPLLTPMPDGFWTPWHEAVDALNRMAAHRGGKAAPPNPSEPLWRELLAAANGRIAECGDRLTAAESRAHTRLCRALSALRSGSAAPGTGGEG